MEVVITWLNFLSSGNKYGSFPNIVIAIFLFLPFFLCFFFSISDVALVRLVRVGVILTLKQEWWDYREALIYCGQWLA